MGGDTPVDCTHGCRLVIMATVANTAAQQTAAVLLYNYLNGYTTLTIPGLVSFTNVQAVIIIPTGGACQHWCDQYTCGKDECGGCRVCAGLEAGQHCSWWCNVYTCAALGLLLRLYHLRQPLGQHPLRALVQFLHL